MPLNTALKDSCVVAKAYAKINIFLKIVGKAQINHTFYHLLQSRFMRVSTLFDTLEFSFNAKNFNVIGNFDCTLEQNTIYKAFMTLLPYLNATQKEQLKHTQIRVQKQIPSGGGLGGGSSNAACFLQVVNKELDLGLECEELMEIGASVGSDVPFFLSDLEIANVEGRGEIITPCELESKFDVEIIYPSLYCSTKEVFKKYATEFYDENMILKTKAQAWLTKSNAEILKNDAFSNNDLLKPLLKMYPELESYLQKGVFLSGSGSCFWSCKETRGIAKGSEQ
ncbi:4-(cytidine 5'-diphospho)-2-C-methyl-D-erythritol kinase [uncultured Helicobacter sp.]|uniref:4-(cytidine 5'-diphospho)-2-C-methyl-D-erythritol kinase n=1 Tax=uncultured Helicobacter sp. TaxID=175537 RepID=UPI00261172BC|nr:4-(cytidine 5'-diphospho)-2-C-methyl-D-erythritol kinase [uncultured Helicobacter sp.]